jgi:hypothetical protein
MDEDMYEVKREILKILEETEDEVLLKKIWSCINGYFSKKNKSQ